MLSNPSKLVVTVCCQWPFHTTAWQSDEILSNVSRKKVNQHIGVAFSHFSNKRKKNGVEYLAHYHFAYSWCIKKDQRNLKEKKNDDDKDDVRHEWLLNGSFSLAFFKRETLCCVAHNLEEESLLYIFALVQMQTTCICLEWHTEYMDGEMGAPLHKTYCSAAKNNCTVPCE
jgi:hypothetical protein